MDLLKALYVTSDVYSLIAENCTTQERKHKLAIALFPWAKFADKCLQRVIDKKQALTYDQLVALATFTKIDILITQKN